jgi:hypothetical protein
MGALTLDMENSREKTIATQRSSSTAKGPMKARTLRDNTTQYTQQHHIVDVHAAFPM